ncbi:MAG: LysM peptidoglycan-binding domain-containing protein [Anaerolineales bacterium]|nr:LysM peptidoglycan-binding domain-containing protein [Anaerolineales bacterium]
MKLKFSFPILIVLTLIVFSITPVLAFPVSQGENPTPTPGPDGKIIYIVQAGQTLYDISIISGKSVEEIRALNNMADEESTIYEGQELLVGYGNVVQPTPTQGESIIPTAAPPTATPDSPGTGEVCLFLFNDENGDAVRDTNESYIMEGAFSVSERYGKYSNTAITGTGDTPDEPICFTELPPGEYTITTALPDGYNPTKALSASLELNPGDIVYMNFGAQLNSQAQADKPIVQEETRSPIYGLMGFGLLLAGIGLGVFSYFYVRRSAAPLPHSND